METKETSSSSCLTFYYHSQQPINSHFSFVYLQTCSSFHHFFTPKSFQLMDSFSSSLSSHYYQQCSSKMNKQRKTENMKQQIDTLFGCRIIQVDSRVKMQVNQDELLVENNFPIFLPI